MQVPSKQYTGLVVSYLDDLARRAKVLLIWSFKDENGTLKETDEFTVSVDDYGGYNVYKIFGGSSMSVNRKKALAFVHKQLNIIKRRTKQVNIAMKTESDKKANAFATKNKWTQERISAIISYVKHGMNKDLKAYAKKNGGYYSPGAVLDFYEKYKNEYIKKHNMLALQYDDVASHEIISGCLDIFGDDD